MSRHRSLFRPERVRAILVAVPLVLAAAALSVAICIVVATWTH